jgi:c-di-GMP-binding flagellar brake protein YcgR
MGSGLQLLSEPPPGGEENAYIESALGVAALLRSVASVGPRAAAYLDDGETFIHTSVLALDERSGTLIFEQGRDAELNRRVLSAPFVTIVTADHGVPVQFVCRTVRPVRHADAGAFSTPIPERVLRLQRRDAFRLPGDPVLKRVACHLFRADKAHPQTLTPAVLDLSCSGISIALPNSEPRLARESRHRCRIELPAFVRFEVGLLIHGSRDVTLGDGTAAQAYGVEFLNLDPTAEVLIQRFITEEERRSKKARG